MANEVTNENWKEAMTNICNLVSLYNYIAFDVEFPGFIRSTPRDVSDVETYADLKANVDALKPIQLGITFTDRMGRMPDPFRRCCQFTFDDFDPELDVSSPITTHFLRRKDLGFDEPVETRISPVLAARVLRALLQSKRRDLTCITFHGLYDIAYLLKLVTDGSPLPEFAEAVGKTLGNVYDTKTEVLLEQSRGARLHHAGYDSLLTAGVFLKLRILHSDGFDLLLARSRGSLYGLESVIIHPPPGILGCCCCLFQ